MSFLAFSPLKVIAGICLVLIGVLPDNGANGLSDLERLEETIRSYEPRSKRELTRKKLDDPGDCIKHCNRNESEMITRAYHEHTTRLIGIGMDDAKQRANEVKVDNDDAIRRHVQDLTISNMGPLFDDLCEISIKTDDCLQKCPKSDLKEISVVDHNNAALYCEPANWPSFKEYYLATSCNNRTIASKPCDSKCGPERNVSSTTRLELSDDFVKFDTDKKKNRAAAADACKSLTCHTDCFQSLMTKECGWKAFDVYKRLSKLEPGSALAILQFLNIIDPNIPECQIYYRN